MDKKYIKSEIQNLLEAINEQTEVISAYELSIPQIELDIVKVNIRDLYEAYIQLDKINRLTEKNTPKVPEIIEPVIKTPEKKIVAETPVVEALTNESVKAIEKEINLVKETQKAVETIIKEQKIEQQTEIEQNPPVKTPLKEEAPIKPVEKNTKKSVDLFSDATTTISDKYKDNTQSINDKLAKAKTETTVASNINKIPISDLKTAIGINDKFRFVNELFEGNLSDYSDTIVKLNAFDKLENALVFLDSMSLKHKWDKTSDTYETLKDLVDRRYAK